MTTRNNIKNNNDNNHNNKTRYELNEFSNYNKRRAFESFIRNGNNCNKKNENFKSKRNSNNTHKKMSRTRQHLAPFINENCLFVNVFEEYDKIAKLDFLANNRKTKWKKQIQNNVILEKNDKHEERDQNENCQKLTANESSKKTWTFNILDTVYDALEELQMLQVVYGHVYDNTIVPVNENFRLSSNSLPDEILINKFKLHELGLMLIMPNDNVCVNNTNNNNNNCNNIKNNNKYLESKYGYHEFKVLNPLEMEDKTSTHDSSIDLLRDKYAYESALYLTSELKRITETETETKIDTKRASETVKDFSNNFDDDYETKNSLSKRDIKILIELKKKYCDNKLNLKINNEQNIDESVPHYTSFITNLAFSNSNEKREIVSSTGYPEFFRIEHLQFLNNVIVYDGNRIPINSLKSYNRLKIANDFTSS